MTLGIDSSLFLSLGAFTSSDLFDEFLLRSLLGYDIGSLNFGKVNLVVFRYLLRKQRHLEQKLLIVKSDTSPS